MGFRPELAGWRFSAPADCLEIAAGRSSDGGLKRLQALAAIQPLILHAHNLSLGGPSPLETHELARLVTLTAAANPLWITAALGFSRVPGTDLGFPTQVPLNESSFRTIAARTTRIMDACGKRLLIRNIAGYLQFASSMPEPEFLNRLCERAGCGVCLDVTSLYVQSHHHRLDPVRWLAALDSAHVVQIAVGGCRQVGGGWQVSHDCSPCTDVLALTEGLFASPHVQAVVLERHAGFPPVSELARDLERLRQLAHPGADRSSSAPPA